MTSLLTLGDTCRLCQGIYLSSLATRPCPHGQSHACGFAMCTRDQPDREWLTHSFVPTPDFDMVCNLMCSQVSDESDFVQTHVTLVFSLPILILSTTEQEVHGHLEVRLCHPPSEPAEHG